MGMSILGCQIKIDRLKGTVAKRKNQTTLVAENCLSPFGGTPSSQEVKLVDRKNHSVPTSSSLIICNTITSTRGATGCISDFKCRHLGFESLCRRIFYVILLCLFFYYLCNVISTIVCLTLNLAQKTVNCSITFYNTCIS